MAMNIISKEKKEIRWIGLPTNSVQECQHIEVWCIHTTVVSDLILLAPFYCWLQEELAQAQQRLQTKRDEVENLLVQVMETQSMIQTYWFYSYIFGGVAVDIVFQESNEA